ncbi:MAG: Rap1a/Tai family immunity protein [Deltaproteobacteria bacterium]|nr:Rap1a/Tai family immunity protein [Deltaproteobacteria bacterium]
MKKICLLITLMLFLYPGYSRAMEVNFLKFCEFLEVDSEELSKDAKAVTISCVAFIKGVVEAHKALVMENKIKPQFCKPSRVTYGKIGLMYLEYERKHSPKPHQNEAEFLLQALKDAYPCK